MTLFVRDPEKRFRLYLMRVIQKFVGDLFPGERLEIPVIKDDVEIRTRETIVFHKHDLFRYFYQEALKQVPWLEEGKNNGQTEK